MPGIRQVIARTSASPKWPRTKSAPAAKNSSGKNKKISAVKKTHPKKAHPRQPVKADTAKKWPAGPRLQDNGINIAAEKLPLFESDRAPLFSFSASESIFDRAFSPGKTDAGLLNFSNARTVKKEASKFNAAVSPAKKPVLRGFFAKDFDSGLPKKFSFEAKASDKTAQAQTRPDKKKDNSAALLIGGGGAVAGMTAFSPAREQAEEIFRALKQEDPRKTLVGPVRSPNYLDFLNEAFPSQMQTGSRTEAGIRLSSLELLIPVSNSRTKFYMERRRAETGKLIEWANNNFSELGNAAYERPASQILADGLGRQKRVAALDERHAVVKLNRIDWSANIKGVTDIDDKIEEKNLRKKQFNFFVDDPLTGSARHTSPYINIRGVRILPNGSVVTNIHNQWLIEGKQAPIVFDLILTDLKDTIIRREGRSANSYISTFRSVFDDFKDGFRSGVPEYNWYFSLSDFSDSEIRASFRSGLEERDFTRQIIRKPKEIPRIIVRNFYSTVLLEKEDALRHLKLIQEGAIHAGFDPNDPAQFSEYRRRFNPPAESKKLAGAAASLDPPPSKELSFAERAAVQSVSESGEAIETLGFLARHKNLANILSGGRKVLKVFGPIGTAVGFGLIAANIASAAERDKKNGDNRKFLGLSAGDEVRSTVFGEGIGMIPFLGLFLQTSWENISEASKNAPLKDQTFGDKSYADDPGLTPQQKAGHRHLQKRIEEEMRENLEIR